MFTGLVQYVGRVVASGPAEGRAGVVRLEVDASRWDHVPRAGDSICVAGCCLTVVGEVVGWRLVFEAVPETLAKTTIRDWRPGRRVNLEHALPAGGFLGGHIVQGHVDGVGVVRFNGEDGPRGWRLRVAAGPEFMRAMIPKGSVCLDGVSLTLAEVGETEIEVALIPETLARTTLAELRAGDEVNVECDVIAKAVAACVERSLGRLSG
ncbi:MAG: riboflavin synthase [Planctomycetota bacterium]|nr:riboflavin synthase [Planctomycetota bacterium]